MNSFEREKENKERRRVALWLAGGVVAVLGVGILALGVDSLEPASANNADTVMSVAVGDTDSIITPADLAAVLHPATITTAVNTTSVSPQATDAHPQAAVAPAPAPAPSPAPTPAPAPTPSDDTDHDGHGDGDGHQHQTETDHSSSDHSSQTA